MSGRHQVSCAPQDGSQADPNQREQILSASVAMVSCCQHGISQDRNSEREGSVDHCVMSRMALNDNKAGMEGLDKERINHIILEASKGSKFYENERKKEEMWNLKIKEQQLMLESISAEEMRTGYAEADGLLKELDEKRDLSHVIVHLDMDAFYAAVEMRDEPSLREKPVAVGGMAMLSTSNYIARRYGVRAAMPGFIGLKLCPQLVMVKPNFKKYTRVSEQVRDVLSLYDPNFSPMSLDEAYLDLTAHLQDRLTSSAHSRTFLIRKESYNCHEFLCGCDLNQVLRPLLIELHDWPQANCSDDQMRAYAHTLDQSQVTSQENAETVLNKCPVCNRPYPPFTLKIYGIDTDQAVLEMRNRIEQRTHLTASAGIAPNTMLAKVCSDKNKPNGQFRVQSVKEEIQNFISTLPIRKIPGIGKVTEKLLGALDVYTCGDLFERRAVLFHLFSHISFKHFMRISAGISDTTVCRDGERKSVSTERTFHAVSDPQELMEKCYQLCHSLVQDLDKDQLLGKTVTLKMKTVKFEVRTRSQSLPNATKDLSVIFSAAKQLLNTEIQASSPNPLSLRLMGVRMSKLNNQSRGQSSVASMFKRLRETESSSSSSSSLSSSLCTSDQHQMTGQETFYQVDTDDDDEDNDDDKSSGACWDDNLEEEFCGQVEETYKDSATASPSLSETIKRRSLHDKKNKTDKRESSLMKFVTRNYNSMPAVTDKNHSVAKSDTEFDPQKLTLTDKTVGPTNLSECHVDFASSSQTCCRDSQCATSSKHCHLKDKDAQELPPSDQFNQPGMICCPLCGQQKLNWPLDQFNMHVDTCLSRQKIKEILSDQSREDMPSQGLSRYSLKRPRQGKCTTDSGDKRSRSQLTVESFFKI